MPVGGIDRYGQHLDQDLIGVRGWLVDLGHPKCLRWPVVLMDERLHTWRSWVLGGVATSSVKRGRCGRGHLDSCGCWGKGADDDEPGRGLGHVGCRVTLLGHDLLAPLTGHARAGQKTRYTMYTARLRVRCTRYTCQEEKFGQRRSQRRRSRSLSSSRHHDGTA